MHQGEYSAILSTFIKLPFVIRFFVLSFLSGRSTKVLLYILMHTICDVFEKGEIALEYMGNIFYGIIFGPSV